MGGHLLLKRPYVNKSSMLFLNIWREISEFISLTFCCLNVSSSELYVYIFHSCRKHKKLRTSYGFKKFYTYEQTHYLSLKKLRPFTLHISRN